MSLVWLVREWGVVHPTIAIPWWAMAVLFYIAERSEPARGLYFFGYKITISNESDRPVTVTLSTAGFFQVAAEFREDVPPVSYDILATPDDLAIGEEGASDPGS